MAKRAFLFLVLFALFFTPALFAQNERVLIGGRGTVVTAGGEPANDIIGFGVMARYRLSDHWLVGASVDKADYDFELPWRVVGIEQDSTVEPIDGETSSTIVTAWVERELDFSSPAWRWFIGAGVGFASPDVTDVTGPVAGGGTFDLTTDAGSEIIPAVMGGFRRNFGEHFSFEFALRADHHLSEWEVTDRVSGATGKTGDYTGLGGHVGLNLRW